MIKLAEHTERLDRLMAMNEDDPEIDHEFDRICRVLFGVTEEDISDENYEAIYWTVRGAAQAIKACRRFGYDPMIAANVPVKSVEWFAVLIIAIHTGKVETDPEKLVELRLEREADEFVSSKGVIRG